MAALGGSVGAGASVLEPPTHTNTVKLKRVGQPIWIVNLYKYSVFKLWSCDHISSCDMPIFSFKILLSNEIRIGWVWFLNLLYRFELKKRMSGTRVSVYRRSVLTTWLCLPVCWLHDCRICDVLHMRVSALITAVTSERDKESEDASVPRRQISKVLYHIRARLRQPTIVVFMLFCFFSFFL